MVEATSRERGHSEGTFNRRLLGRVFLSLAAATVAERSQEVGGRTRGSERGNESVEFKSEFELELKSKLEVFFIRACWLYCGIASMARQWRPRCWMLTPVTSQHLSLFRLPSTATNGFLWLAIAVVFSVLCSALLCVALSQVSFPPSHSKGIILISSKVLLANGCFKV